MATLVDALVVTLGLDSSSFKAGQKETTEGLKKTADQSTQVAKLMEEQGKKAASFFSQIKNELLALVGISLSIKGMKDLIVGTADNMASLGRSASALRMSARELDAWQHTAMAFGGTADELTNSMQSLNDSLYAFSMGKGGGDAVAALNALGISAVDATGKAKSMGELYKEIGEQFRSRHFDIGTARQYGAALGMSGNVVQMELDPRSAGIQQGMYQHSGVTDDAVAKSQQFQIVWAQIDQTFQSVREKLFTALIPYIEQLLGQLDKFATWVSTHQTEINAFFTGAADEIKAVSDSVGGVQNAFELLLAFVGGKWLLGMLGAARSAAGAFAPLLAVIATANRLNNIQAEAKSSNTTVADVIQKHMAERQADGDKLHEKIVNWFSSLLPAGYHGAERYDAYGTNSASGPSSYDAYGTEKQKQAAKSLSDSAEQHAQAARRIKRDDVPGVVAKQFDGTIDALNSQNFASRFTDAVIKLLSAAGITSAQYQPNVGLMRDGSDAVLPRATGAGKALLDWMGGQFSQLETQMGLPSGILRRIVTVESGGNQFAVSGAGAQGLFQLMPGTARDLGLKGNDVFDPEKSAQAAARYLRQLLNMFGGDITKAVAAYNEGPGALQRRGMGNLPHETADYINRVLGGVRVGAGSSFTPSPMVTKNSSSEVHINNLNVVTQATDAAGIASAIPEHIRRNEMVAAANGGPF